MGPPLLSASWSPPLSWAMPLMTIGGVASRWGRHRAVAGVSPGRGGCHRGGRYPRARGGSDCHRRGRSRRGRGVVGGRGGGVVLGIWAAGLGLVVAAWELDMSPNPRARPPATRAAITAMRIPSRLVIWRPLKLWRPVAVWSPPRFRASELSYVGRRRRSSFGDVESWSGTRSKPFSPPGRMYRSDPTGSIRRAARRPTAAHTASGQTAIAASRDRDRLGRGVGGGGRHRAGRGPASKALAMGATKGPWTASGLRARRRLGRLDGSRPPHRRRPGPGSPSLPASAPCHRLPGSYGRRQSRHVSVALLNSAGTYLGYINVTPRQGPRPCRTGPHSASPT